jgi:large subunit ribosomal protein L48
MKGYNFDILESFQSYVHNLAENMGVDVEDAWATPARSFKVRVKTVGENMR